MGEDQPGRRDVRGKRDAFDITDLEHGIDIRFMRMRGQGVPEEDDCLDLVRSDHRTNLKVPAFLSGIHPGDVKAGQFLDQACLLYTSDAADDLLCVDLGGRRIIKKKKKKHRMKHKEKNLHRKHDTKKKTSSE